MSLRTTRSVLLLSCWLCAATLSAAADQTSVGITSASASSSTRVDAAALSHQDQQVAQMWGLTTDEMQRALVLLQGPRGSFSNPNLSPVEALGIHARSDQERRRYAQLWAKAFVADVQRVLAWSRIAEGEVRQLVGDTPVINFAGLPGAQVNPALAAGAHLPMSIIQPTANPDPKVGR